MLMNDLQAVALRLRLWAWRLMVRISISAPLITGLFNPLQMNMPVIFLNSSALEASGGRITTGWIGGMDFSILK
jgi:hypothetical protein